jgi:uncharacterized protein
MNKENILSVLGDYKNQFAQKYGIVEIGVFGSIARDDAREDSDLDICIKTVTPDPFALVHIKEDLEKRVRRRVDIVRIRGKMNPFLRDRIKKEGIYV